SGIPLAAQLLDLADLDRGAGIGQIAAQLVYLGALERARQVLGAKTKLRVRPLLWRTTQVGPSRRCSMRRPHSQVVNGSCDVQIADWPSSRMPWLSRRINATAVSWFLPKNCSSASLGTSLYDVMIVDRFSQVMPSSEANRPTAMSPSW